MADMPCRRARGRFLIHQHTLQPTMNTNAATRNRHPRYTLFTGILLWCIMQPGGVMAESGNTIALPAPDRSGTRPLETLLHQRRSVRDYADTPLELPDVGQLLWAAQGITHPRGLRTALNFHVKICFIKILQSIFIKIKCPAVLCFTCHYW